MSGHARLSASQTKRWVACPGSAAWLEANPGLDGGSGYHAQMGTCAHALVERCLGEGSEPVDYKGRLIQIIEKSDGSEGTSILKKGAKWPKDATKVIFEVDTDMIEAVERMTEYIKRRIEKLGVTMKEVRLEGHVTPLPDRDDTGGTADVIIDAWPDVLEVVDYKHGSGVFVPVEGNEQLRSYALGALREAGADDYETVRYTICQPRHLQAPSDGIMSENTKPKELLEWGVELADHAKDVDAARNLVADGVLLDGLYQEGFISVGEDGKHCTFCPILSSCPAAQAKTQELAVADFDDEPTELEADAGPNHLSILLPWVPFIDKWLRALEADAERLLLQGGAVTGYKVVRGRSNRSWVGLEDAELATTLIETFGLTEAEVYTKPKLITGPQAEKLIAKDRRKDFNAELLHKPEGKLTIAPEDDKRDAVEVDPASDFDDVED